MLHIQYHSIIRTLNKLWPYYVGMKNNILCFECRFFVGCFSNWPIKGGDGEFVQSPCWRWKPAPGKRTQPAQVSIYTLYTLYTSLVPSPPKTTPHCPHAAPWPPQQRRYTDIPELSNHLQSLHTLHFTSAAAMQVLGPLLTVTVLEHLRCDACSSSLELQCCSDNTIKLQRSINNLQSSSNKQAQHR